MTEPITAVNAGSSSVSGIVVKKTTLSDSTKSQLEALGIAAADGMTEAEAQAKIAAAKQEQAAQNQPTGQGVNLSEEELLEEARNLASTVGVPITSDEDLITILDDIGAELEMMLEEAGNNPSVLSTLSSYLSDLTSIDERYDTLQTTLSEVYAAMDMEAANNKLALGLS